MTTSLRNTFSNTQESSNDTSSPTQEKPAFETQAIHSGEKYQERTGAVIAPVYLTSTFKSGNPEGFDYTRSGNPNFTNLEQTLANLENAAHATVFSSGVAAITAIVSSLQSGDKVVAEKNIYGCTFRLFAQVFRKFGVEIEYYDFTDEENFREIIKKKPTLVWIESPTNPLLKIVDIEKIAEYTREAGSTLVVDNTFASSFFQKPLDLGADLSLSSTTKYINGHSDCLGGVVCTNTPDWQEKLIFAQKALGLNPSPFDSWLVSRGVKTLSIRMKQHEESALKIARFLESAVFAGRVIYPFLPSHPQYKLARKQMSGGSGIVSADIALSKEDTIKFLKELKLFTLAESLGGVESLVCHPATMTHASIPQDIRQQTGISDSLVRFSVGVENATDLIEDIQSAYLKIANDVEPTREAILRC